MSDNHSSNVAILTRFIATLSGVGDLAIYDPSRELPAELDAGNDGSQWSLRLWKPAAIVTPRAAMEELYRRIPHRFPPLYEELALSYRWLEVQLDGLVELYANTPGPDLEAVFSKMTRDRAMTDVLFQRGLLPFGKAADGNYDPVCFDTARVRADGDSPIVRVEHEALLWEVGLGRTWPVSESFRAFLETGIQRTDNQ